MDASVLDAVLKAKLLSSLEFFVRYFFKAQTGKLFQVAAPHKAIIEALHSVARGEITRLIINVPPRYGKTEIAVKSFIAWGLVNNPAAKYIHLSYSDDLALDNSSAVRELIKSDEYQRIFATGIKSDSDSKKKWYTENGGGLYATSAGGAITGFGAGGVGRIYSGTGSDADGFAGAIIIDDPLKPDDAFSDTKREVINRRFNNTIASRTNSMDTPIIVIMQRLHEDDMTGFLLGGGTGEEWHHVCLPAIDDEGAPLWPEKHDLDTLERMKQADPYTFSGQYMQRPSPLGGGIIKGAWFQRHDIAPVMKYHKIYADTAQKTKERNDYSVFQLWGFSEGRIYLCDQVRGKWEAPELRQTAIDFWNKHRHLSVREMVVEDKASGTGLIQDIKRSGNIPIRALQRDRDKLTRVMDVVSYISSGYVSIPNAPFASEFIAECEAFTANDSHAHDDQIDPMCDAIHDMLAKPAGVKVSNEALMRFSMYNRG